jgi:hypothetical protein
VLGELMLGALGRGVKPAGGRGTELNPPRDGVAFGPENPPREGVAFVGAPENPPRDGGGLFIAGPREGWLPLNGGRGMFRAIVVLLFSGACCICELPSAGRCILLAPGRGTPRTAGDGTAPDALSDPCGIIRDGVKGADPVRPAMAAPAGRPTCDPFPRLKLAGGVIRETTGRIPLRAGGAAAR